MPYVIWNINWHIWIKCNSPLLHMIQLIIHALYPRPHSRQILHRNWKEKTILCQIMGGNQGVLYGQCKSGLYNEPLQLNLTYKQTWDSVLRNVHCHDVMLSFAKQCTLHSSIVENTFHFAKLYCKLAGQVFLSTLTMLRKHRDCRHFECHLQCLHRNFSLYSLQEP